MQRLSNWFEDHLPLRKRDHVKRSEKRKASKSVTAPRMRYTVSNAQKQNDHILDQLPFAGNGPHSMSISMIGKNSIFDDGYTGKLYSKFDLIFNKYFNCVNLSLVHLLPVFNLIFYF